MNYSWLTYEDIEKAVYPNLLAEIKESGYSTSTLADFMGLSAKKSGEYRPERDPEVWDKLLGKTEIIATEAFGLVKYFGVELEYLFSHELRIECEKPLAHWRWYDENRKKQEEIERSKAIMEIYEELVAKPYLLDFMKKCITLTEEQQESVLQMLKEKATA